MHALRYDTEVPYPEENAMGQPSNNAMSWMGTNVAWAGRTPPTHPTFLRPYLPVRQTTSQPV